MARDLYELGVYYNIGPQPGMNVFHFASDEEASDNPDVGAAAVIAGWQHDIETEWLACLPNWVAIIGYKARRINNLGGPGVAIPQPSVAGARTGDMFTSGNTATIIWNYKKADGHWRAGRTFLPGVTETDMANNAVSNDLIEVIQTFIEAMIAVPCFATTTPAISFDARIYSPTHETHSGIEAAHVSGKPGQMNRRLKPSF
jgi:hypothetical protein